MKSAAGRAVVAGRGRSGARALPTVLAAVALGVLTACSPAVPEEWTLDLEPELVLGGPDATESDAFFEPMAIGSDGEGNLHVLDSGNDRVQVFSPSGSLVASLGRSGQGPGELHRATGLWVFPDGEVVVADAGNGRLTRFGPGGAPLPVVDVDFPPLDVVGTPERLWVLRLPPPALVRGSDPEPLVRAFDRDGVELQRAVEPVHADIGLLYFLQNTLRIASAPGGGFALADTHVRSRIRVHDRHAREVDAVPVLYKAEAWAPLGRVPRRLDDDSLATVARTASDLAWDPRRGIWWVLSGYVDRDPDGSWVVGRELYRYAPDGSYRGSVILPFVARRVAPAADGAVWLLDDQGAVRRMRVRDPEAA